ncbi:hypothetical protein V6Z12_A11G380100 [Gossypium hirsutum]
MTIWQDLRTRKKASLPTGLLTDYNVKTLRKEVYSY